MDAGHEIVYREQIEPLMRRMADICRANGLPAFMTVQVTENSFRTTCINADVSRWDKIRHMELLSQSWSIDELIRLLIADARETGAESLFLSAMGVLGPYPQDGN